MVPEVAQRGPLFWTSTIDGLEGGSDPAAQMGSAFRKLGELLQSRGATLREVGQVTVFVRDQSLRQYLNGPWLELFPDDGDRPARRTTQVDMPAGQLVQLLATGVRGAERRELALAGITHRDPIPFAVKLGNIVFSSGITAQDGTGAFGATPDEQIRLVLRNMIQVSEAAGGGASNIAHVWMFMRDAAHQELLVKAWLEAFPLDGERPARKTIRYELAGNQHFQAQMTGVLGTARSLEIPGIGHHDPIPMATLTDGILFTSGIGGLSTGTRVVTGGLEPQTARAFDHLQTLCEMAGGSLENLGHLTVMLGDFGHAAAVERELADRIAVADQRPSLHFTTLGLPGGDMLVQLHGAGCFPT